MSACLSSTDPEHNVSTRTDHLHFGHSSIKRMIGNDFDDPLAFGRAPP